MRTHWWLIGLVWLAAASPAIAQFQQYTPPGGPDLSDTERKERLAEAVEQARWDLGSVRVDPWFGIRDVGYVDRGDDLTSGEDPDLTASVGAGLRFYLPTGPDATLVAHALPEYTWWQDRDDRNRLNGRYGLGFFGFWNRLTLEATATRDDSLGVASAERQEKVNTRREALGGSAELGITRSLRFFVSALQQDASYLLEDDERNDPFLSDLQRLDRTEEVYRAGVRFVTPRGYRVGVGVEASEADFEDPGADRSNSGESPYLEISKLEGPWVTELDLVLRSLDPEPGSSFEPFEEVTGRFALSRTTEARLQPSFYARRDLVYSLATGFSYFEESRFGGRLGVDIGWRLRLDGFVETGTNDYTASVPGLTRSDDVTVTGVALEIQLRRAAALRIGYTNEDFDSDVPGFDRTLESFQVSISLAGGDSVWY